MNARLLPTAVPDRDFFTGLVEMVPLHSTNCYQAVRSELPNEGNAVPIQKITPFLWFDHQAEEAATFYTSIFPNSKIVKVVRYSEAGPGPAGSVMTVAFELEGQSFTALNGGPHFKFNESISFVVHCQTQVEVDNYWDKLSADGGEVQCGWVKDKFGLSWQVVPDALLELLSDPDPKKAAHVQRAMMGMRKLDIAALRRAAQEA
jgi:predicted 3-demethylubiquinone-9 3-methyltransferase (glyoxalase superfamily)